MKPEDITADNLEVISKNSAQIQEIASDSVTLNAALQVRTADGWNLLMLAALYQTSSFYLNLIKAVDGNLLGQAILNINNDGDNLLLLTLYLHGKTALDVLREKISLEALKTALVRISQCSSSEEFNYLSEGIGHETVGSLISDALVSEIQFHETTMSSLKLLSHNIKIATLGKNINAKDPGPHFYSIVNSLNPLRLNKLIMIAAENPTDVFKKFLSNINRPALAKAAIIIDENKNNALMLVARDRNKVGNFLAFIDALHKASILNRVALRVNENRENLLIILLRCQEITTIKKLLSMLDITVLQKTMAFMLGNNIKEFDKLLGICEEPTITQVLIDASINADEQEFKILADKLETFIIKILLSISDAEFIMLMKKLSRGKPFKLLLSTKEDERADLIKRWNKLSPNTLLNELSVKNDNKTNMLTVAAKNLGPGSFITLIKELEKNNLPNIAFEQNHYQQDLLMFTASFQEDIAFLTLVEVLTKTGRLNEAAQIINSSGQTALMFIAEKRTLKTFVAFLCHLNLETLNKILPSFFELLEKNSIAQKNEKFAIAHIWKIHQLIANQPPAVENENVHYEESADINKSRKALNTMNFQSISQAFAEYQESFSNILESERSRPIAISVIVKKILDTPYVPGPMESETSASGLLSWIFGTSNNTGDATNRNQMQHLSSSTISPNPNNSK